MIRRDKYCIFGDEDNFSELHHYGKLNASSKTELQFESLPHTPDPKNAMARGNSTSITKPSLTDTLTRLSASASASALPNETMTPDRFAMSLRSGKSDTYSKRSLATEHKFFESIGMLKTPSTQSKHQCIGGLSTNFSASISYVKPKKRITKEEADANRSFQRRKDIVHKRGLPALSAVVQQAIDGQQTVNESDITETITKPSELKIELNGDDDSEEDDFDDATPQFATLSAALGHEDRLAKSLESISMNFQQYESHNTEVDHTIVELNEKLSQTHDGISAHSNTTAAETTAQQPSAEALAAASYEQLQEGLRGEYHKYFGQEAFREFQDKFHIAVLNLERYVSDASLPEELRTPRSIYLRSVSKRKLLPLPLILRDPKHPFALNLNSRGLGDARMMPVIDVIDRLPSIQSVDFADNRLTDVTLMPLATKLQSMTSLTYLDLSFNKMDDSSATIMDYLRDESCQLRTLLLNGADVDDNECGNLCRAIAHNRSLRTLGLAKNLIGKAELMNVVNPDLITGGEALGDMLKENKTLTKLDLSWNSVRLESAIALAESLETNQTLKILLLGYNSFGDMPSQVLGRALKLNKSLTELDLESNAINPKAATVLANAISFNETLLKLNINGNTLGKIGAQALVAAIQRSSTESRKLQVSFINCDCIQDDHNIFSAANPHGTWRLNLKEPYGQMVAAECLYLANFKVGCRILRLIYQGQQVTLERSYVAKEEEGEEGKMKKFKLEEFYRSSRMTADSLLQNNVDEAAVHCDALLRQFGFVMEEEQRRLVLKKTLDLWTIKAKREGRDDLQEVILYEIFFALFVINDTDLSGTMELDEFLETLASLGRSDIDTDKVKKLMGEYDRDESGSIDANEFGTIMINEFCRTEIPRGELVDSSTGKPWEIPPTGHCVIQLSYQCDVPTLYDIGADHGIDNIIKSIRDAKTDDQREILFQNTTSSPYFFLSFEQAQLLYEEMSGLNRLPLDLMASILPQIVNEEQAIKFIDTNLDEDGKFALRIKLGPLYGAFVGLSTGHYALDLRVHYMRNGGRRLGAICVTEGKACRQSGVISSQKGNFSNFRNEKLGVQNVDLTGRWFATAAASQTNKTLRFDYVSTTKPRKATLPMTDARFDRLIQQLDLEEIRTVYDRLKEKEAEYLKRLEEIAEGLENCDLATAATLLQQQQWREQKEKEESIAAAAIAKKTEPKDMMLSFDDDLDMDLSSLLGRKSAFLSKLDAENEGATADSQSHTASRNAPSRVSFSRNTAQPPTRDSMLRKSYEMSRATSAASLGTSVSGTPPALSRQQSSFSAILKKEANDKRGKRDYSRIPNVLQTTNGFVVEFRDFPELLMDPPLSFVQVREAYCEWIDTCYQHWDIYPEERMRDVSRPSYNPNERPETPDDMKVPASVPSKTLVNPIFPLIYKKILKFQIMMPQMFISIMQLKTILEYLPPNEGYLRVLLIQSIFSHIVDTDNIYLLLDGCLTLAERIELFHRIGIMNILDPMKPDRTYRLDLRRFDHREWVKILVQLAIAEPGDNWEEVEYRWGKYDDPVPGWTLPATWCYGDDGGVTGGPRNHGWLRVSYRSYGNGCMPVLSVRKYLRKRTLAGMKRII